MAALHRSIPQSFIDDVLTRSDIVEIISARLPLRKRGANYLACCPFHQEKTPSFSVHPQKQFYHCFGCGESGNSLSFLMKYDRLEFIEALTQLAKQVGLTLPQTAGQYVSHEDHQPLYRALMVANQYYQQQLRSSERAVAYLKQRELTGETAKKFGIGYAPAGWDHLLKYAEAQGVSQTDLLSAGLLSSKDDSHYDRFRDRIIFPIQDRKGRVIAFGGRIIDVGEPKYLNSPETAVFHKSEELYGLFQVRELRRAVKTILVVEGYMDVVALAQFGVDFAVGTLGTAVGALHLRQLMRVTEDVVFCFDGDEAGKRAAARAFELALSVANDEKQWRFLFLPASDDPDSFIRREGSAVFLQRVAEAMPLSDYFFIRVQEQVPGDTLEAHAKQLQLANSYWDKMSDTLLKKMLGEQIQRRWRVNTPQPAALPRYNKYRKATPIGAVLTPMRLALALLIQHPSLAQQVGNINILQTLENPGRELLLMLLAHLKNNPDHTTAHLIEHWRDDAATSALIAKLASVELLIPVAGVLIEFQAAIAKLEREVIEQRISLLLNKAALQNLAENERQELSDLIANK